MFFSILNRIIFLQNNNYIDTSVQKGVPGILGFMEYTGVISQLFKEAKANKVNLAVLLLDRKNTYGSIPYKLVEEMLKHYHVPNKITKLILDYYNTFKKKTISKVSFLAWHNLERSIITGCTISATLFTLAMKLLIKPAEVPSPDLD